MGLFWGIFDPATGSAGIDVWGGEFVIFRKCPGCRAIVGQFVKKWGLMGWAIVPHCWRCQNRVAPIARSPPGN